MKTSTKRKLIQQKLMGLAMIAASVVLIIATNGNDATFALITVPLGLWLIFTREIIIL